MSDDRLTITLCGSLTRAADDLARLAWHLKAAGHHVHAPTPAPPGVAPTWQQLAGLTGQHSAAIRRSDLVIAVVPDRRIGDATANEMRLAVDLAIPHTVVEDVEAFIADITDGRLMPEAYAC
jgi:hypothetical protein